MTGAKCRVLTTDDLMHKQEEPDRKRMRRTLVIGRRRTEWGDETSGKESVGSSNESDEDSDEDDEGFGDDQYDDDANSEDEKQSAPLLPERFNFSRIAPTPHGRTSTSTLSKQSPDTFLSLGVSAPLQAALSSMSIRTPTGVQAACIPPLLAGELLRNSGGRILR